MKKFIVIFFITMGLFILLAIKADDRCDELRSQWIRGFDRDLLFRNKTELDKEQRYEQKQKQWDHMLALKNEHGQVKVVLDNLFTSKYSEKERRMLINSYGPYLLNESIQTKKDDITTNLLNSNVSLLDMGVFDLAPIISIKGNTSLEVIQDYLFNNNKKLYLDVMFYYGYCKIDIQ